MCTYLSIPGKHIRTRIPTKSTKSSSSRSRRFGRPSKPTVFGRQNQKNWILKPTENRRHQKNMPQKGRSRPGESLEWNFCSAAYLVCKTVFNSVWQERNCLIKLKNKFVHREFEMGVPAHFPI